VGIYLNPGNEKFAQCVNSEIYIDKTGLIRYCSRVMNSMQKYICMSRPRRFGKSVAADMLAAFYSRGCDSGELFAGFEIAKDPCFQKDLNKYHVLYLNMQEFLSRTGSVEHMLGMLERQVIRELAKEYPAVDYFDRQDLPGCMQDVYLEMKTSFVIIIDEWDCVFREYRTDAGAQKRYLDFLRGMLKDKGYISLCYMTGILPVKKYGTHSALNMFDEFSMTFQGELAQYAGFTEKEVLGLCSRYGMDFEEMKKWYDGYVLEGTGSVYNPRSVVSAMRFHKFQYYWNQTETFEALRVYIDMNFEGLRDVVLKMMNEKNSVPADIHSFTNDMVTFHSKDDVLTLLVHLGYLGYRSDREEVFIPNQEILNEYVTSISNSDWGAVSKALKERRKIKGREAGKDEKDMDKKGEQAKAFFLEGYNCTQSVALAFGEETGIEKNTLLKTASSFGGGMGRMREVCGAVSGMFLVAGALYGYDDPKDLQAKKEHYARIQELAARFRARTGSIVCRELLGLEGKDKSPVPSERTGEYYKKRPCAEMIALAAELMEQYIAQQEHGKDENQEGRNGEEAEEAAAWRRKTV